MAHPGGDKRHRNSEPRCFLSHGICTELRKTAQHTQPGTEQQGELPGHPRSQSLQGQGLREEAGRPQPAALNSQQAAGGKHLHTAGLSASTRTSAECQRHCWFWQEQLNPTWHPQTRGGMFPRNSLKEKSNPGEIPHLPGGRREGSRERWLAGGLVWVPWDAKPGGTGMLRRDSQGPFHPQQCPSSL